MMFEQLLQGLYKLSLSNLSLDKLNALEKALEDKLTEVKFHKRATLKARQYRKSEE